MVKIILFGGKNTLDLYIVMHVYILTVTHCIHLFLLIRACLNGRSIRAQHSQANTNSQILMQQLRSLNCASQYRLMRTAHCNMEACVRASVRVSVQR